jgi:hypothetical protein
MCDVVVSRKFLEHEAWVWVIALYYFLCGAVVVRVGRVLGRHSSWLRVRESGARALGVWP